MKGGGNQITKLPKPPPPRKKLLSKRPALLRLKRLTFFLSKGVSSIKWSVLAHLKSQPLRQNFQAQKPVERSSPKTLESTKIPKTHLK